MTTTPTFWSSSPTIIPGGNNFGDVSITALAEGGFALAYTEVPAAGNVNIVGRIVGADGNLVGGDILLGVSLGDTRPLSGPDLVQVADGTLVATYNLGFSATDTDIVQARLSGPGYTNVQVSSVEASGLNENDVRDTVRTADGGSVVMYARDDGTLQMQRVDGAGTTVGGPVAVSGQAENLETEGDVTVLANGRIVAVWKSFNPELGVIQIRTRLFNSDLTPVANEFELWFGPNGAFPEVTALTNGNFVAVWQDVSFGAIVSRVFDSNGTPVSDFSFLFGTFSILPRVTALQDGGYILGWSDFAGGGIEGDGSANGQIVLQRYGAAGAEVGGRLLINAPGDETIRDLTTLSDGRVVVAYVRETGDSTNDNRIAYDIIDPRDSLIFGEATDDEIFARRDTTTIFGLEGNDSLFGFEGDDTLDGGFGADLLSGGEGDDLLDGDFGRDVLDGGRGGDSLSGGAQGDVIRGGLDGDTMRGGTGADRFDFDTIIDSSSLGRDRIVDFVAGTDLIDLRTIDARAGTPGNNAFEFIGNAAFSAEGQVRVVRANGDTEIQVNTATGGGPEMVIVLDGIQSLSASDFIL